MARQAANEIDSEFWTAGLEWVGIQAELQALGTSPDAAGVFSALLREQRAWDALCVRREILLARLSGVCTQPS